MTYPDDMPRDNDDEEPALDATEITTARGSDANEADLIEQAIAVPLGDEDDFDR